MVSQLSLVEVPGGCTLAAHVDALRDAWLSVLGHGPAMMAAERATRHRFREWGGRRLDSGERDRVAAYFGAAVRGGISRSHSPEAALARRRLAYAAIRADLIDAGWDAERAASEALRVTGVEAAVSGAA